MSDIAVKINSDDKSLNFLVKVLRLSLFSILICFSTNTSPVSNPSSIFIIPTPVILSPSNIDH